MKFICCYNLTLMKRLVNIFVLSILLVAPLQASQDGVIVRSAQVYADANSQSRQVGRFLAGTTVSVFSRKGGWKEVFSEDKALLGWVRGYQVREGGVARQAQVESAQDERGFLAGLASFSRKASRFFKTGGSSTSSGTATIGVRGLSEEQIKSARPDFEELEKMHGFSSSKARLAEFRQHGQLSANEVAHLKLREKPGNKSSNEVKKDK